MPAKESWIVRIYNAHSGNDLTPAHLSPATFTEIICWVIIDKAAFSADASTHTRILAGTEPQVKLFLIRSQSCIPCHIGIVAYFVPGEPLPRSIMRDTSDKSRFYYIATNYASEAMVIYTVDHAVLKCLHNC